MTLNMNSVLSRRSTSCSTNILQFWSCDCNVVGYLPYWYKITRCEKQSVCVCIFIVSGCMSDTVYGVLTIYHLIPESPKYWFKIYCFENIWNNVFRASVEFIFLNVYLLQFLKLPFTIINFINDYRYNIIGVFYFMILLHSNAAALSLGGLWLSRVFSVKISNVWEATLLRQLKDTLS